MHSVLEVRRILQMSEPSDHRKFMLRIAKLLSREDVDDILYLSEDCTQTAGSVSSGVDLMRSLERDSKLGPGNYTYLLSCLREIGRIDLQRSLKKSLGMGDDDTLPFLPPSFCATNQLFAVKISSLQHKRGLFISSMCCITDLKKNHQGYNPRWSPVCERKYTCLSSSLTTAQVLPSSSKITKVLVTTLDQLSKGLSIWTKAMGEFMQHRDHSKIAEHISEAATHVKMFVSALDSIGWRNEWRSQEVTELRKNHPLKCASLLASSTVRELASELLGESKLQDTSKDLSAALTTVESMIYLCLHDFVVMHWLTTLMEFAAYCSVDLQSYRDSLRSMIKSGVDTNWAFIRWVLCGTKLLDKIESEGLVDQDASSCMTLTTLTLDQALLPVILPLTLMVLLYSKQFTPQDWLLIRARISNHFKGTKLNFQVAYSDHCTPIANTVRKELDHFIQQSVDLLGTEVGPVVRELAVAVFQH